MKKVFKFIVYALLSIIGLIAIFLTTVYVKSYFSYKEAAKLIGKEAPMLSIDGHEFRDLNKNGKLDAYEDFRVNIEDRIHRRTCFQRRPPDFAQVTYLVYC
jgi:beta-glucosidase